jgi:tetratricopeptide (TPR) repeat protein
MVEREEQLNLALNILLRPEPSRIAIIGGGGFGKTTLARMILHDSKIIERYQSQYFLSCEGISNIDSLLLGFGSMLGLKVAPSAILLSARRLLETSTTLICFDNFETPWEAFDTRTKVEELLEFIADIPNVSLIITIRGEQRPSKVAWSKPLLQPLLTLSLDGAREILQDIASDHTVDGFTLQLLQAIDGIPLAVTLVSTLLRDGESSESLWGRWSANYTKAIHTGGDDRLSNLNRSIALSVDSLRMNKDASASRQVLAALSLLPNGFPFNNKAIASLQKHLNSSEPVGSDVPTRFPKLRTMLRRVTRADQHTKDVDTSAGMASQQSGISDLHTILETLRAVALIRVDHTSTSPRLQMLSPIRLFCNEFLFPETLLVLENVANYYITIMLRDTDRTDAVLYARVVPEILNVHSVFQRVFNIGYSQDITRLIDATSYLTTWSRYIGYLSQDTIQMALKSSVNFPIPHAGCLMSLGHLYDTEGQHTKADTYFTEAAALYKEAKDVDGEAWALERSGNMLSHLGQHNQSEVAFKTSLKLYTQTDNKLGQALVLQGLGDLYRVQGRFSEAQATLSSALEAYQQISYLVGQASVAQILSDLHFNYGNLVKAEKYATEALNTAKQANSARGEGNALRTLGNIYLALDRVPEARQALEQSLIISKQQNDSINQLNAINNLAEVYIRSDQLSAAEALLTASSKVELDVVQIPDILTRLGWIYICGNRLDKAEPVLDNALQLFRRFDRKDRQAEVLAHLATIYFKSNRLDEAEQVLKSILELDPSINDEMHQLWVLGDLYIVKGEFEDAEASLDAAMAQCQNSGFTHSYERGNILRSMGTLHVKQSRADLAIDKFKESREFHRKAQWVSEQATDLKRLGEAYEMLERAEEAGAAFREAEELMESVPEARTLKE